MTFRFILKHKPTYAKIIVELTDSQNRITHVDTALVINEYMWDDLKERPKNIYLKKLKKLNVFLDRIRITVAGYFKEVKVRGKALSLSSLSRRIKKVVTCKNQEYKQGSLLNHINNYINSRQHIISQITYRRYKVFFRLIERFEGHEMRNYMIEEVNADFVKQFLKFGEKEFYSRSTLHRTIYFIRTILNFLERRGIRTFVYELELPKEKKQKKNFVILSEIELSKIRDLEVPKELNSAKDWLVISCYLGQRFSDFMSFNISMLEVIHNRQCISFMQQKTGKNVILPLHPIVRSLISKNNGFPLKLSLDTYNKQIKEIVRLAGIKTQVYIRKRFGFRSKLVTIDKCNAITSHIGRRSFASNFYGKIPTALLMDATGHGTEQMFNRYISNFDTERVKLLSNYFEDNFNNKNFSDLILIK